MDRETRGHGRLGFLHRQRALLPRAGRSIIRNISAAIRGRRRSRSGAVTGKLTSAASAAGSSISFAHPDLPKKFGFRPGAICARFYEPAIAALAETDIAFEINTAGLRKECRELYPAREFLELAREAGVPLLINSDAHDPAELGAGFVEAITMARAAGYTETVRFVARERTFAPLSQV